MEIRCTANELKELLSNKKEEQTESREKLRRLCIEKTPVDITTDVIDIRTASLNNQSELDIAVLKEKFKESLLQSQ